ncbi:MAG: hypothetical protein M0Z53_09085 [Thermaerobacter sp.]|nr:hypothetical protein [Thermaerobacter sp.]
MKIRAWVATIALAGTLATATAGCGATASANTSNTTASASVSASKHPHKKPHLHRVKGQVVSLSATQIVVKTKAGTQFTFPISSKTHFRQKKTTITAASIHTGATVLVVSRHTPKGTVTMAVRLL